MNKFSIFAIIGGLVSFAWGGMVVETFYRQDFLNFQNPLLITHISQMFSSVSLPFLFTGIFSLFAYTLRKHRIHMEGLQDVIAKSILSPQDMEQTFGSAVNETYKKILELKTIAEDFKGQTQGNVENFEKYIGLFESTLRNLTDKFTVDAADVEKYDLYFQKNIEMIFTKLDVFQERLQGAVQDIGHLDQKIHTMQDTLSHTLEVSKDTLEKNIFGLEKTFERVNLSKGYHENILKKQETLALQVNDSLEKINMIFQVGSDNLLEQKYAIEQMETFMAGHFVKGMQDLQGFTQESNKSLTIFEERFEQSKKSLEYAKADIFHILSSGQKLHQIFKGLETLKDQIVEKMLDDLENFGLKSMERLRELGRTSENVGERSKEISEIIYKQVAKLEQTAVDAQRKTLPLHAGFAENIEKFQSIFNHFDTLLEKSKQSLSGKFVDYLKNGSQMAQRMETVSHMLEKRSDSMMEASHKALQQFSQLNTNFFDFINKASEKFPMVLKDLSDLKEDFECTSAFVEASIKHMVDNSDIVAHTQESMRESIQLNIETLGEMGGILATYKVDLEYCVKDFRLLLDEGLDRFSEKIAVNANAIREQYSLYYDQLSDQWQGSTQDLRGEVENILSDFEQVYDKIHSVAGDIQKDLAQNYTVSTQEFQKMTREFQKAREFLLDRIHLFEEDFKEVPQVVDLLSQTILEKIQLFQGTLTKKFQESQENFQEELTDTLKTVHGEVQILRSSLEDSAITVKDHQNNMRLYIQSLEGVVDIVALNVQKIMDESNKIDERMKELEQNSTIYVQDMEIQTVAVFEKLKGNVEDFSQYCQTTLLDSYEEVPGTDSNIPVSLKDRIDILSENFFVLKQQIESVRDIFELLMEKRDLDVADQFNRLKDYIENFNELIKKAGASYDFLAEFYRDHSTQKFLSISTYIIERLQSIAVDITRFFKPGEEDDLWRRFYKGEVNIFLRFIRKHLAREKMESIRKVYQTNNDFRRFVDEYITEYRLLIGGMQNLERKELLDALFLSSDAGKLFLMLSDVLKD